MNIPSPEFIKAFKETPGAFSVSECIALLNITSQAPKGNYIEAGSHAGKSGMAASYGLPKGTLYMVDPIYDLINLEAWKHSLQGHPDNLAWDYAKNKDFRQEVKKRILFASGNKVRPVLIGSYSELEIPLHGDYSYALVDSDNHTHDRVFSEVELLKNRMVQGGIIAFHDFGNQYIAPREAHQHLLETGEFENIEINWAEIFNHVRDNNLEDGNVSWHNPGSEEFPKFIGACKKK